VVFAIEVAIACLRRVSLRYLDDHLEKYPEANDEFTPSFLAEARQADAICGVFD
jgi:hypothetical protein